MENSSRVGDIRKKFEGLNAFKGNNGAVSRDPVQSLDMCPKSQKTSSGVGIVRQDSGSSNPGNKGNIKRSHAFRSDKQPRTLSCPPGKMVTAENSKFTNIRPLASTVTESSDRPRKDLQKAISLISDQISVHGGCPKVKLNVNFNPNKEIVRSSSDDLKLELDILPNNKNDVESASCYSRTQKTKFESLHQPDYSIVLKPRNRTLFKTAHRHNISQSTSPKKSQTTVKNSFHGDRHSHVLALNKPRIEKIDEIRGKSSNSNLSFNKVKSVFENNEFAKHNFVKLPEQVKKNSIGLNEVLKSPLPKGPPPKKPPRTFAHTLKSFPSHPKYRPTLSDSEINSPEEESKSFPIVDNNQSPIIDTVPRPIRSKTESQIMLKKLEIALLNHQHALTSSASKGIKKEEKEVGAHNSGQQSKSSCSQLQTGILKTLRDHDVNIEKDERTQMPSTLCFKSLNCSSSSEAASTCNIYDTPFEPKSTFFVEKPVVFLQTESLVSKNIDSSRGPNNFDGQFNKEHIYAEPCDKNKTKPEQVKTPLLSFVKNEMETSAFHKEPGRVTTKVHSNQSNNELHYMSTPILDREKSIILNSPRRKKSSQNIAEAVNTNLQILTNQDAINSHFLDKHKIQMMVNEAYGKCLNLSLDGGSDSDSIASTPDDTAVKTLLDHEAPLSTDFVIKEREKEREQRTAERKGYLRRVCSRGKSFHRPASVSDSCSSYPNLFEYLLLIGLDLDPSRCKVPYIKTKYPPDVSVPNGIEFLCFPDASDWPPQGCKDDSIMGGCYCIVLTNSSGVRKYGYCRRVQPEGAAICLPLAYCVVSPFKDNVLFNKILVELESHHGQSEHNLTNFIEELYKCPYPAPGQAVVVTRPSTEKRIEIVRRPFDQRQEEVDIARLLNLVRLSVFMQLFGTLLLERKVVLISHSISKLSACVEGLQAALYPFHWQHTLVPVVPSTMVDLCHAPTPYIIGLLKHRNASIEPLLPLENVDQVLVVDVDESRIIRSMGDESSILPSRLSRGLKTALQLSMTACINSAMTSANLIASEALLRLFVELLGHYRDHIITSTETGKRDFQRENFVKSVNSSSKQHFLDWFSETAMFTAFIEERLDRNMNARGLFEQRCVEYLSDRSHPNFLKSYKGLNKTVKTLGDRLKDWAALS